MIKILKYHWRAILWLVVIVIGSLLPGDNLPATSIFARIPHFDKMVHFILYFTFTLFLMSGFSRQYKNNSGFKKKAYVYSFIIAFLLGASIEFIQEHVGRSYDEMDMIANTTGIAVSLLLFNPIKWILRNIL
ncbi:MAG: VanZ family protein [Prevotellaceae bacterium]|jgi:VanZ family protein|nr:VanZ family protein [Prevotellaceae bacterium]